MKTVFSGNTRVSFEDVQPYQNITLAPEAAFDDLTRLAACICQTPIALLYLIDAKRQWLKAQVGIDPSLIPAYLSLCREIILETERWNSSVLMIEDAWADSQLANHPLVQSPPRARFYGGTLLVTSQGIVLGMLAVIDSVPRSLSLSQQEALIALSEQGIAQLECRKSSELTTKNPWCQPSQDTQVDIIPLKSVIEKARIVAITNSQGKIKYVNEPFCQLSQYSREELCGQNHRIINSGYHSRDFFKQLWRTIRQGQIWQGDIKNQSKDGRFYWVNTTIVPILNARGKPQEYVSICQDITKRKEMEEKYLSPVICEAAHFFELSSELMCIIGSNGEFKQVNPAFTKTFSYSPEKFPSQNFFDFVHPDDRTRTQIAFQKLLSQNATVEIEHRYCCPDGSYKWLAWKLFGQPEQSLIYVIGREIGKSPAQATLQERANISTLDADVATLLGQSNALGENLQHCAEVIVKRLHAIGVGIWIVNPAAVEVGKRFALDLQASAGELLPSDTFPTHVPPNHHLIGAIAQTQQPLTTQLSSHSGRMGKTPQTFSGYPLILGSRLVGVMALHSHQRFSKVVHNVLVEVARAIAIAITRAWARDELLSRREALLCQLANHIRNVCDLDAILNMAVKEVQSLLDVDSCHFLWCFSEPNRPSLSVTHEACKLGSPSFLGECLPPDLEPLAETIRQQKILRIDDLRQALDLESPIQSLLRSWGVTCGLLLPLQTHNGQLGAIVCIDYNKTRQWSDAEVELLQAIVDQLAIAIEQAELFASTRAAALAAQTQAHHLELALQDLQQTEAWLIQSEKMSGLGQMVAGVAHEINNPVSFITGNLSHAANYIQDLLDLIHYYRQYYPSPIPKIQEFIEEIDLDFLIEDLPKILSSMKMGADRIHEIVLSLKNFSRLDDSQMKPTFIHEGIDSTLLILHNRLKPQGHFPGIKVIKEYGNLPPVECYAGQLNQVFMNIISNAIDALESYKEGERNPASTPNRTSPPTPEADKQGSGEIALPHPETNHPSSSPSQSVSLPTIWIHTEMAEPNQVRIRIRDNGPGMNPNVVSRLFDPFFTTKPVGKGTGLGLSISYQIVVKKHKGSLQCSSEPGQGAEFVIQIPISPRNVAG
jgi:PAS domain S-box-containing protein